MRSKSLLKEKAHHGTALVPLSIYHLSYDPENENYFYLHWHDEMELVYVFSGGMVYQIEDKTYFLKEGEGAFINANQLHSAKSLNHLSCEAMVIVFHPTFFNPGSVQYEKFIHPIITGQRKTITFFSEDILWQKTMVHDMIYIFQHRDVPIDQWSLMLVSKIYAILHQLYSHSSPVHPSKTSANSYKLDRLKPVLDYIHDHYSDDIHLGDLSQLLPMSNGQFCRIFKEAIGLSPIAYLLQYRILRSCELLIKEELKIAEIARQTGFNNVSHFNRAFMKEIGCTPSEYRHKNH